MTHTLKLTFAVLMGLAANDAIASNTGLITHPMVEGQKFVTTEFTGITSSGGGVGAQLRYTQELAKVARLEAGVGIAGGDYSGRGFVGGDMQLLEDYDMQPRVSMRGQIETSKIGDNRINTLTVGPTVSKGFNFWGTEAFPFLGLPFGVNLNGKNNSYKTSFQASVGATSKIALQGWENLTANAEILIKLKDSYTGFVAGLSYSFN